MTSWGMGHSAADERFTHQLPRPVPPVAEGHLAVRVRPALIGVVPVAAGDQERTYEGRSGHGIFEIRTDGRGPARYPNWPTMDMSAFRQKARGESA